MRMESCLCGRPAPPRCSCCSSDHDLADEQVLFDLRPNEDYAQEHVERPTNSVAVQVHSLPFPACPTSPTQMDLY